MIDIHSHILPGVDDGAKDMTMSLEMARQAQVEGITHILATPHHRDRHYINPKNEVLEKVDALQKAIDDAGIDLQVFPCQEVHMHGELSDHIAADDILFVDLDATYILIEFPHQYVPQYAEQVLFELLAQGIRPIIVHPERNQDLIADPTILERFISNGCYAQVTAASYVGVFGKKVQDTATHFIEKSLVQFMASDAHRPNGMRGFYMKEAYDKVAETYGQAVSDTFTENAAAIIDGEDIQAELPIKKQEKKKKSFLDIFKRD